MLGWSVETPLAPRVPTGTQGSTRVIRPLPGQRTVTSVQDGVALRSRLPFPPFPARCRVLPTSSRDLLWPPSAGQSDSHESCPGGSRSDPLLSFTSHRPSRTLEQTGHGAGSDLHLPFILHPAMRALGFVRCTSVSLPLTAPGAVVSCGHAPNTRNAPFTPGAPCRQPPLSRPRRYSRLAGSANRRRLRTNTVGRRPAVQSYSSSVLQSRKTSAATARSTASAEPATTAGLGAPHGGVRRWGVGASPSIPKCLIRNLISESGSAGQSL